MGDRVTILGAGESGTGAALLAKAKGYNVFVSDKSAIPGKYKTQLQASHIDFEEGKHTESKILNASLVVKSPGIPDSVDLIEQLRNRQVEIIDELEFASRHTRAKLIAVTGTNGKTTTTLLAHHILKTAGVNAGLAGNVGESLAKQVILDQYDYYVVEMSSFQIDGITTLKPDIVVMLNITPDHLDRYDYKFSKYAQAKFSIVNQLDENGKLIYFSDDQEVGNQLQKLGRKAGLRAVSLINVGCSAYAEGEEMTFGEDTICQRETTLRGKHNLINTMSAVLIAKEVGLDITQIKQALGTFSNAPHRLEYIATIRDVDFYNDSKATNVESTKYALDSFTEQLVWIAGGIDKGNNYQYIREQVHQKVKALVCLGKDNEKLKEAFHHQVTDLIETEHMADAVKSAMQYAQAHDVVLLSPACSSFDLFDNYEHRGDQFKKAVLMLKETYDN